MKEGKEKRWAKRAWCSQNPVSALMKCSLSASVSLSIEIMLASSLGILNELYLYNILKEQRKSGNVTTVGF